MKNNQKGSMLVWAVIIIFILLIIVGTGLSISFSYFNRSLQYTTKQQAYYTAQSTMETIVGAMNQASDEQKSLMIPTEKETTKQIPSIDFHGAGTDMSDMEEASAQIDWIEQHKVKITVKAHQGTQDYTLYGDAVYMRIDKETFAWVLYQMYDDETNFTIQKQ